MKLTQIRNATLKLDYAGATFLIDPMLAEKEAWAGFAGTARSWLRNPMVSLPLPLEELLDVDAVIVTHTHLDHWDDAAQRHIPKDMLIYTQNVRDAALIRSQGFSRVHVLAQENTFTGITLWKTGGQHGSDALYANPDLAARMGETCGLVFDSAEEKRLYIAGDTVWAPPYIDSLERYQPEVVVLNIGCATVEGFGPIIMGKEDASRTLSLLPQSTVVASHMEAVNHCLLSRAELREYCRENGIEQRVFIPEDGEMLSF